MESYIKDNANDITYKSERSPFFIRKQGGLNRAYNLRCPPLADFRKLCTH